MHSLSYSAGSQDTPLFDLVFQRIAESREKGVSFAEWMEIVLYHPEYGYYSRLRSPEGQSVTGRRGDFYTSVSVGETFGFLLAHRVAQEWATWTDQAETGGEPCSGPPLVIVEQGAHDGQLARDLIAGLREIGSPCLDGLEYRIVEPRAFLRDELKRVLSETEEGSFIHLVDSLESARAERGIFLCNELLDAFPVNRWIFEAGQWQERRVGWDGNTQSPQWVTRPLSDHDKPFAELLGSEFPEGYTTEVCSGIEPWMAQAASLFERGTWWIIDYGYEREDYYAPQRHQGTLRTYYRHEAGDDPFVHLGEQDITAHVDFTRVEEAALAQGLHRRQFTDQHHFLIEAARPWLLSIEGQLPTAATMKRLRQFQTLTHPTMMGQQFKVMEFTK